MSNIKVSPVSGFHRGILGALAALAMTVTTPAAQAITVNVKDAKTGASITGYRWTLEEDATWAVSPGYTDPACAVVAGTVADPANCKTQSMNLHRSYMPVVAAGNQDDVAAIDAAIERHNAVAERPENTRYYLSVLPDEGYTMSGVQIPGSAAAADAFTVRVNQQPVPTAQIFLRAFEDNAPINNVWDNGERALGGWTVFIYDAGGQLSTDVYGNPLGTVYEGLDAGGAPRVKRLGDGTIHTMTAAEAADPVKNPYGIAVGEALIKNIAPDKYGVQVIPPYGEGWVQTATIEGTKGLDVWVKANEPRYFAEFGPAGHHAEFGFVRPFQAPEFSGGTNTIKGQVVNKHMYRPPNYNTEPGHPLASCWVGVNNQAGTIGLYAAACDGESKFAITNVPDGTYTLVFWDEPLLNVFAFQTVTVGGDLADPAVAAQCAGPETGATTCDVGKVQQFMWFGNHFHFAFFDENGNGKREPGEAGVPDQAVNLRYRDGSIYGASTTDTEGFLPFEEVFPFFSFLVAEIDYARFKATGLTVTVDAGGPVVQANPATGECDADPLGYCRLTPQIQDPNDPDSPGNPETGYQTRTELGPVLTEGFNAFLGTTNIFEWGKQPYGPGENGGISGIVHYATTRAENDPRFAAAEDWEPGIPRVQVNLYEGDIAGVIQDVNGGDADSDANPIELSDVDNFPFGWADGGPMGPEDVKRNGVGGTVGVNDPSFVFNAGDAINVAYTDSFDDSPPTGCPGQEAAMVAGTYAPNPTNDPFYMGGKCYDGLRNYNQVRPTVFDGGYAFFDFFANGYSDPVSGAAALVALGTDAPALTSGQYVVEAVTPAGYKHVTEESKNVDFGDAFTLSPFALPPECVGESHVVGDLSLFPGVASEFTGQPRPLCDRKSVLLVDGKNPGIDFFMYTDVPVAGHIQGFVLNDLANEFNQLSPNFGEKFAPAWIPVSVRDWAGNEVYHTYTDEWGQYNAIVPSTYTMNAPMPSGVSQNMLQVCLNSPMRWDATGGTWVAEEYHKDQYTQFCYTLNFQPGTTTYLDTPVLPIAAFTGPGNWQLDCEYPTGTPVISWVSSPDNGLNGGPYVPAGGGTIEIHSPGMTQVLDPSWPRVDGSNAHYVERDFRFYDPTVTGATAQVYLGDAELTGCTVGEALISCPVPLGAATGQLRVVRSDTGLASVNGVTVTVGGPVREVLAGHSIQEALDAASPGDLILVQPGMYQEMLVMTKPVQLQGWGAGAVTLNPVQSPTDKIAQWREKVNYLANCRGEIGLLPGQGNNTASPTGPCGFTPGTGLFPTEEGAGVLVAPLPGAFAAAAARIDGFRIVGADQSGAIIVNGYANGLEISNNILSNNQGPSASGIRIGHPASILTADDVPVDAQNDNVSIHHNHVTENGGLFDPGAGIGLYTGSDNYRVTNNNVCGNFAMSNGGGIAHYGLSNNGLIADNAVLFNQSFDQTILTGGYGGGILVSGYEAPAGAALALSPGSGSVRIERNRIQGNQAGSGNGGGIALRFVNGLETSAGGTANWYRVDIAGNLIVNNVTGVAGGGISLEDAVRTWIVNNTIANNDSTATAGAALNAAGTATTPQPAGVVAFANTAPLTAQATGRSQGVIDAISTFSNAVVRNNILVGNRSQYWETALDNCPADTTTGVRNCLTLAGFRDVDVLPAGTGTLHVEGSLLTNTATQMADHAAEASNQFLTLTIGTGGGVSTAEEQVHLIQPYFNGPPCFGGVCISIQPDGTLVTPEQTTALAVAAATDEGGNFVDVHYGPLSQVGDYHLVSTSSLIDAGLAGGVSDSARLDIDWQVRPFDSNDTTAPNVNGTAWDVGADEISTRAAGVGNVCASNNAPTIDVGSASWLTYIGVPFRAQVIASDRNAGQRLTFSASTLPAGLAIDPATGVVSGSPTGPAGPVTVTVTVSDGCATNGTASADVTVTVSEPGAAPTTVADAYTVDVNGPYVVANPGVLSNDANAVTARLGGTSPTGGTVALASGGGFTFTPSATFVGTTSFTYVALNAAGVASAEETVALSREVAVTDATYYNGTWTIQGVSTLSGQTLTVRLVRASDGSTPLIANATHVNRLADSQVISDTNWSLTVPDGVNPQPGDTLRVTSSSGFVLNGVAVFEKNRAGAPRSTAYVQCPGDRNGDAIIDHPEDIKDPGLAAAEAAGHLKCEHLGAGDGFARMADGTELYTFGFDDLKGTPDNLAIDKGILNAQWPGPTLVFDEGDQVFLTLTNVGMLKRPDLFDPHTVHFHGFPNAASVFDGVPDSSIAVNMASSLTYYWNIVEPGTYMYHCHVEAAEHMQMGMLANLYVRPKQNGTSVGGYSQFVYNDDDGSTGYDVEKAIQIGSFDSNFHTQHINVQPLPFAEMKDDYPMLNGRGYPDTVLAGDLPVVEGGEKASAGITSSGESSQKENSIVTAAQGQRVLLRISNLNVTQFYTLGISGGLTMKVVGRGAHILRGPAGPGAQGTDLYYETQSVTLGGGEAVDVLIDTTGAPTGTYLLYSTNLNELSNGPQDFGGMMTEIEITAPVAP